jgi:hypothetical protein
MYQNLKKTVVLNNFEFVFGRKQTGQGVQEAVQNRMACHSVCFLATAWHNLVTANFTDRISGRAAQDSDCPNTEQSGQKSLEIFLLSFCRFHSSKH